LVPEGDKPEEMAEGLRHTTALPNAAPWRVVDRDEGIPLREQNDEWLMLEHGRGSEEAFEELVRRHRKSMLNYMYRMVHNRQVGEELTQEVFMALVKNAGRYEPRAKFTTYLYSIAFNIVSKEWSLAKRRPMLFSLSRYWNSGASEADEPDPLDRLADERADVVESFERDEVTDAVNEALKHIPDHQREAFVLRRFQGLSYEEVSNITNSPVGTVKSRVVRAERALRPLLVRFREYM